MRLLFTPPLAGRRRALRWGGLLGPAAPGAPGFAGLGGATPTPEKGGARHLPGGKTTPRRRSQRQPRQAATRCSPAAAAFWEPSPRVHTSPHKQGNSSRESRCPPGVAGEEAQSSGPHSPGIPPPSGPVLPASGVISPASLPRREERADCRRRLAPGSQHGPPGNRRRLRAPLPKSI